jgi:hypothetical protein
MEGTFPASQAGGAGGGISHSGDVSVRAPISTSSTMSTASASSTAGIDALPSSNSLDGRPSTGTATTNVSDISLPAMDSEDRVKSAQSAASAVMASFSSTSDWIRSEVRSFKIIPGPFQPSTPPVQIAEGIEAMEGDRPRAKHEKPNEGVKHSVGNGHEKNTPPEVVSGAARILSNPSSFQFTQSSLKLKANSNNTERAHSPWEANSVDTVDSGPGPGIGGTAPLSEMEIKTIIECEKMNYLTSQTLLDREKDQEREHLERLESENISGRNWIEKLNGATETIQNKFNEMKNKMSPEGGTPCRSRSASETLTLPLSLTAVLSDMLTLNSSKSRRESFTSQSEHTFYVTLYHSV